MVNKREMIYKTKVVTEYFIEILKRDINTLNNEELSELEQYLNFKLKQTKLLKRITKGFEQ